MCRVVWRCFIAQFWGLWNVLNKHSIERIIPGIPADYILKTISFFQLSPPREEAQGSVCHQ